MLDLSNKRQGIYSSSLRMINSLKPYLEITDMLDFSINQLFSIKKNERLNSDNQKQVTGLK